jgi:hypothetical protein
MGDEEFGHPPRQIPVSRDDRQVRRVVVLGRGEAGKSVLARRIGALIDGPVIELDTVFWRLPDLRPLSAAEWRAVNEEIVRGPRWGRRRRWRPRVLAAVEWHGPHAELHVLRRPRDASSFLRSVPPATNDSPT